MDVSQASLLAAFRASKRAREGLSSGSRPSAEDPPRKKLALEDRPRSPPRARGSRRDSRDPGRVREELSRKEKERGKREEPRGSRARTDRATSHPSPPRLRSPPRPRDRPEPSQQPSSAAGEQLARFERILAKEVTAEQFTSHFLRSSFLAEQAALEAAVRASSFHGEVSHLHAELMDKMKQLEVELGGERAKVAELEDGMDKMSGETSSLRRDKVDLLEKLRVAEAALEKKSAEADSFRDRLRSAKAKARSEVETVEKEVERLRRGEGVDYELAIQSPDFSPIFDVLKGMVQGSVRASLAALYPDFDFSLYDASLASGQPTAEQPQDPSSHEEGGDRAVSSPKASDHAPPSSPGKGPEGGPIPPSGEGDAGDAENPPPEGCVGDAPPSPSQVALNPQEKAFLEGTAPPFN